MAKKLSKNKAEKILHDKQVKGRPLTEKQRKFFGAVASGAIPKAQIGRAVSDNTRKPINVPLSKQELEENKYVKAIMHQYDKESYLSPRNESTNPIITAKEDKKRKTLYKENQRQQLYDETVDPFIKLGEEFATPMQAIGLFPHPVTQTIGRIGDLFVASASARNAKENLEEGNIGGAIINTAFGAFPFMRKGKNLFKQQGGSVESRMGGLTDKGFNYNGAWGGQFAMGGMLPGVQGHMYARTGAPSEGKYAKKTLPSAAEGYEVLPDPTDPERKYKLSAVVQSAKDILNPVLRSKNPKMYDEWMQGRIDAVRSGNLQKYESERPLSIYLTPDEIKNTLSKQNKGYYDEYLTALKELNMFKELGKDSYAGQIEGEKPLGSLLYGSRLSTAPVNLGVDEPSGKGFRYSYNPSTGEYKKETFKNGGMMSYYQHGLDFKPKTISKKGSKIKKDNDGYWNPENWGKPVEIDSNEITMQGVYEPLLGVSDTGDTQMMFPGQDYTFKGNSVTEYPVAQNGINQLDAQPIKKLDQLLNFTNFNDMANAKKGKKVPQAQAGLSRLQPLASESTSLPRGMDPRAKAQLAKEIELINKRKKEEEVAEKMKNFPVVKPASRPIDSEATRRKNKAAAARLGLDYNEKTGAVSSPFSEKTDEALRKLSERTVERGVEGALYAASLPARMVQSMYKPNYTAQQALMGQASDASFVEEMFSDPLNYPTFGMKSLLTKVLPKAAGLLPLFKVLPQDPQAVGLYQQYLDNVRSILGRADVMRQAKDKGNILAQSYGRFDPAYGRAFQEPSILPETIESIAESLISVDPRTRTISSAQKEYMDKLRRFTINSQSVSTAVSNPQTSRTIYNFTPEETLDFLVERAKTLGISPVDAVPVIRQHFRNMPQITDVAIMREFGNTLESPIAEPLAAVRMARDLVPDIQKRISTLFNSAREARPQVNISDEFLRSAPRQRLGDAKSIIGSMGLGGNDYRPISSSIMSPRVLNDVFDFWTGSLKTKVQDWLDDPNKLNLAMSKVERDSKTPKEVQDLMKLWNKDREEIINILRNPSIHNDLFRTAGFTDEEIQEAARTAMSPAAVAEREKRMSSQVRTGLNETFEPIIVSDRAGKQYTTPFTFNKGRLFTGSKSTSSDSWPLFLSAAGDETYRGVSDIVPLEGGYEGIYGHTNDFGGGTKYAETIIDLLTGREAMPDFTIRRAAIPIVRDMVRNMLEVRPLNFEIDRFNNPVIVKKGPNRQREAIPHPSLPTTNLPSAYHDPTRGIEGETFKPEIGIVPKGLVPRTDVEKLPKPEYFDTLEEYEDAMNKYRYGKWFQGKGPKAKLRKGGTLPKAQIGTQQKLFTPENIGAGIQAGSDIGKAIQTVMRATEQRKIAKQTGALAPLVAQAAATRDVDTPNMLARQMQANRPEYNLVTANDVGVNPFGTGYDVLSMAQNGTMISGNPTEIQNTYAPTTLYDDLGYEPLDESSRVKRFIGGGNVRKALIGDTIGLIGKGANLAGDIVAGIMDIGTRRMNRQSQQQLGQAAFQSGMQGLLGGQMGAYMKHGGDVGDEYKWVSHSWQPQVITKFGEHNVKDLLRPDPMMNTLRAGGHLKEYTAPSERAMSTERPQFAMGGELNTHWGGDMELASYNPYMPGSGETHVARGLYHSESDGRGNTGIGMSYGGNMVEVENGEPVVEMQEGGSVQDKSAVVFGNLKIPSYVASELGDKDAKGKMFKSYVNDLTKKEVKQNKLIDKALEIIENYDTNSPFDILSLSTAKAMLTGADMKLQEIAMKKMTAAGAQQAMHETADEMGFDVEKFINRGKIVQAKNGANTAQSGTYTPKTLKANLETPKFMQPVDFDKPLYTPQGIPQLGDVIEDRYSVTGVVPEDLSFRSEFYNTPERKKGKTKGKGEMKAWDIAQKAYNELLPFIRPLNQMELQPEQLAGEMMALATNVLEPVQAQFYQPMLEARAPKMTAQEALNRNQADFNALARQIGNNPAALAVLSAQKQAADRQAIAQMEAFNIQQEMATRNRNISTLNDASLKNLAAVDLQYQRQAGARSSTKAQAQTALNSIASKIGQNKLENLTSGVMQNMYNYRFGPKGRIINYNPLLDVEIPTVTDKKQARNGSIVKAIKNL